MNPTKKERMLRDPKVGFYAVEMGIRNRKPRNGEYAGPHSDERTKKALELTQKYRQKASCGPRHFVYPSGLIGRKGKVKHNR